MTPQHWLPKRWNRLALSLGGFLFCALIPELWAQESGVKSVSWPVKWDQKGVMKSGRLQFNQASRKLELTSVDQKNVDLGRGLLIHPDLENPRSEAVREHHDLAVGILGYQERLTGRIQSIVKDQMIEWTIPGHSKPVEWPLDMASAWALHPSVTVALFEDFEKSDFPGAVLINSAGSPAGDRVIQANQGLKFNVTDSSELNSGPRLIQLAVFDSGSGGSLKLKLNGSGAGSEQVSQSLELKSSVDPSQWSVEVAGDTRFAMTPLPRKNGWHWLSISIASDRTRICLDELVLAESRTAWFKNQTIEGLEISAAPDSKLLIDAIGIYQYDTISGPVQRPLAENLIQLNGGHETLGNSNLKEIPTRLIRAILPKQMQNAGRWVQGPVVRLTFQSLGENPWKPDTDREYLRQLGLLNPPEKGFDCVEGSLVEMDEKRLTLALSQGGTISVERNQCFKIEPLVASGLKLLEARPHHLGDELDLKVIPPEPEGGNLKIEFNLVAEESKYQTELVVDVLQVLGANIAPFVESIKRGELVTEVWLNGTNLGTLNSKIEGRNESPERLRFPIGKNVMQTGANQLEFRQKGQKNDPNYLDDLSVMGVRLYRVD